MRRFKEWKYEWTIEFFAYSPLEGITEHYCQCTTSDT